MSKPKMRIQLLNPDLVPQSDRLVAFDTEMANGPTEVWKDPIKLEVVLADKGDILVFEEYLKKIQGQLPLPEKTKRDKPAVEEIDNREQFVNELKLIPNQGDLIKHLREKGFVCMDAISITDYELKIDVKTTHTDYQFFIRPIRIAKNPSADKYDESIAIGIKIRGDRTESVKIYLYGKFMEAHNFPWDDTVKVNFKKLRPLKFPPHFNEEERMKFSKEYRQLKDDPTREKSKFYLRWEHAVEFPTEANVNK